MEDLATRSTKATGQETAYPAAALGRAAVGGDHDLLAGHRTLAEVDKMFGTEFEEPVTALCRRDGCTDVRRVGGAGGNGSDVTGRVPDGRTVIIQCKHYLGYPGGAVRMLRRRRRTFRVLRGLVGWRPSRGRHLRGRWSRG